MIDSLIIFLKTQLANVESTGIDKENNFSYMSLSYPIPYHLSLLAPPFDNSFFLTKPEQQLTLLGLGCFVSFQTTGKKRFKTLKRHFYNILKQWYCKGQSTQAQPLAFLGFAFDEDDKMQGQWQDFSNTFLTIPQLLIKEVNSKQYLIINIKLKQNSYEQQINQIIKLLEDYICYSNESKKTSVTKIKKKPIVEQKKDLDRDQQWHQLCHKALAEIQTGHYDKLVISRTHTQQLKQSISLTELVANLIKNYHSCSIMSYQNKVTQIVAASPEQLINLHESEIQCDAIGGTIFSCTGSNKQHPLFRSNTHLLIDKKLLKEHYFVSQDIFQRLDSLCDNLKMPLSPSLMKLPNFYHLETNISGRLKAEYDLFNLIETLHPTPAVAGFPAQKAKNWLIKNEHYQRGWYSGAFGWIDAKMNGSLSVMLRCALIQNKKITSFAGAGLIAESDPNIEWLETELKMQTILQML